jgi:hypothetical protein
MPRNYDLLFDYGIYPTESGGDDTFAPDSITTSPFAIVAVWRYKHPVTFSRNKSSSFSKNPTASTELREKVLIITDDIQQMSVSSTKSNHVNQLGLTLHPGMNYLVEFFPGDWIGAWIVNDKATFLSLLDRIQQGKPCNKFYDGLKFIGKISSSRKSLSQSPDGTKIARYSVTGVGFSEFDASIYYEAHLASISPGIATDFLRKTGEQINNLISQQSQSGGIDINKAMPLLLDAFFGAGVPESSGFRENTANTRQTYGFDNPNAFIVPEDVGHILGQSVGTKPGGQMGWKDICEVVYGIQKYQVSLNGPSEEALQALKEGKEVRPGFGAESVFSSDGIYMGDDRRTRFTDLEMLGSFLPSTTQFNGQKTVWAIMQQFLNPSINEMYTTMRVNPRGDIMPTAVIRQLPFSSGIISEQYHPKQIRIAKDGNASKHYGKSYTFDREEGTTHNLNITRFMDLPRWKVHPILVKNLDIGRSDALRFNFVHIMGERGFDSPNDKTYQIVRDPPIIDDLDIARNGLRPYMMSVNCSPTDDKTRKAGDWMYILSDILMGQHMTLSGSIDLVGVQSPICIGDNIEFDNHVFHIETVTHSFSINPSSGAKTFDTMLTLSHGAKAEQLVSSDFSLYSGTSQEDLRTYDPNISTEYQYSPSKPSNPEPGAEDDNGSVPTKHLTEHSE